MVPYNVITARSSQNDYNDLSSLFLSEVRVLSVSFPLKNGGGGIVESEMRAGSNSRAGDPLSTSSVFVFRPLIFKYAKWRSTKTVDKMN
jgi:hypothetical protein